jgi:hypothetical protein
MPLVLGGATSGSTTLTPVDAVTATITLPSATSTLGIVGPAYGVYRNGTQTLTSATNTKVQLDTEQFDTANCYDSATNYRFTPNVAGYYQINACLAAGGSPTYVQVLLYKNGASYKNVYLSMATAVGNTAVQLAALVPMNGSTDYIEIYAYVVSAGTPTILGGSDVSWVNGTFVRSL